MKTIKLLLLFGLIGVIMGLARIPWAAAAPLGGTPTLTETATVIPTATPTLPPTSTPTLPPPPTETLSPTVTDLPSGTRPLVVVERYFTEPGNIGPGSDFTLHVRLANEGQIRATNLIVVFTPGDLVPLETGGVLAYGEITPGDSHKFVQPMHASSSLIGQSLAALVVTVTYGDDLAGSHTETFNLNIPLTQATGSGVYIPPATATSTPTSTPTPSATPAARPQLIVSGYTTDPVLLKPGLQFTLFLDILNTGNGDAQRVTMITGGGTASTGTTPGAGSGSGGVSGGSGELTNFSPLGSSNVQAIGAVNLGSAVNVSQALIVNVTTNPGAYPLKISFAYNDSSGATFVDDQVITLLVQSPPLLDLSFYRDPGPLFAGQPNFLPVQVVNQGRKSTVLGNMRITAGDAYIENNTILIGTLEAGGYYTLDPMVIPNGPGPLEILIEVDYTDDFNVPQRVTQTIIVEVQEGEPIIEPPIEGGEIPPEEGGIPPDFGGEETFWQKVVRFLKGLFGLDSGVPQPALEPFPEPFTEEFTEPIPGEAIPLK